ncbi:UDP-glucuronate 4-epimerase 4 [Hibiscus syriacus]|uniref:UDP-glucuronate 4-epimerase 4 n=1 Tax=Hibiscus syriacus TaxID=106335 RepID=A0A6A3B2C3_HIBSY|nr:UDP-glucuronate 4-epimerase 4 [Hibiscus syriacus]
MSHLDNIPSTPGKFNMEKSAYVQHRLRWHSSLAKLMFWSFMFMGVILIFFFRSPSSNPLHQDPSRRSLSTFNWGGPAWEKLVSSSSRIRSHNGISVLVTGAAGFVGTHVSAALKRRGDGVLGLDNFNDYYDPWLKRARRALLEQTGVYIVEGDINDSSLLRKLFDVVAFTHVMHLATQAGVRYAMENPGSYVHSNIAGFVSLLEISKSTNSQPAIVWASSSSVYGLNTKVPFPREIELINLLVYMLRLRKLGILKGKSIQIFEAANHGNVARDFTYVDIVRGCLGALDTAEKSTGSGGKKKGPAQLRVYNLGNTWPVPVSDLVSWRGY